MPRKKQEEVQKPKQLKVTLIKSTISQKPALRKTVEAMGLKKLNSTVTLPDNDAVRGMVFKVKHLVTVDEI
jgi:large subunit ribosomal protein L30